MTKKNLLVLVEYANQELDSNMKSYQEELESVLSLIQGTNRRLGRLYDVIETGKLELGDIIVRIRELREQDNHLQARRVEIEALMSDRRVALLDIRDITEYVTDMQNLLQYGSLTERKSFIKGFVKEIKVTGSEAKISYSIPEVPEKVYVGEEKVPRIVHHGGQ